jgi:hypothetical protein
LNAEFALFVWAAGKKMKTKFGVRIAGIKKGLTMKHFAFAFILALLLMVAPAQAVELLNVGITTAITQTTSQVFQVRPGPGGQFLPATLTLQCNLTWGSGGTTVDADLQTSLDGGTTWVDIANCNFSTIAASKRLIWTLESSLVAAPVQVTTPTDGTMTANTALSGVYGTLFRIKYQTTGTFAGGTSLRIDAVTNGLTTLP